MRKKITVIGAGNVGATCAFRIAEGNYADIVVLDIVDGLPQGKALDMRQAAPIVGSDMLITGTNSYQDTAESDIVIITSGLPRKPGMSRDDLVQTNAKIVREVTENVMAHSPDCMIIVVCNPLDAMVQMALHVSGLPRERVFGQSGVLDSSRMRAFIAAELNVSVEDVHACVLGGHGDTMVPVTRLCTVGGVPLDELMAQEKIDAIVQRTINGGAEIVGLLKTGSAFYAPGTAAAQMAEAVIKDRKKILPCAVRLDGEYGISGVVVGVPVKLGAGGVEQVFELTLTETERSALAASAGAVRGLLGVMGLSGC